MTSTFNHTVTGHYSYMSDNETKEDTSNPTMTKEEGFRAFVDKLDFWDDMPMFIRVLSEKLSRGNRTRGKKWSQLSDQRKSRLRTVLTQVTNMVCCGEFKEFLQDYASHSTFIGPAAKDDGQFPDCANLLKNLMGVYNHLENKGQQYDQARFGILQSLHGVRGCKTLKAQGWRLTEDQWQKVSATVELSDEAKEHKYNRGSVTFQPVGPI